MKYFSHPKAICESTAIGDDTRVWAFAHILPGAQIGGKCNICDHVFIENDVVVGDRVTLKSGVQLWDGLRLEDDVFVGPNATFSNDKYPRSKQHQAEPLQTVVEQGASLGANCTILPGIRIGRHAMIGAGTVVTADVPPYAILQGNPGRIVGYDENAGDFGQDLVQFNIEESSAKVLETPIKGVSVHRLTKAVDLRGHLVAGEFNDHIPFTPKRIFMVHDVPSKYVRGEHAHRQCHQFLMVVTGSVSVVIDNGEKRTEVVLDSPDIGLYVPPMNWTTQYKYSKGAVLTVLASEHYEESDYIRTYSEFIKDSTS